MADPTARHRTTEIPETLESIPGYPDVLKIYHIGASPFFHTRCFMNGCTIRRSTRTDQKAGAIAFAKKFYNELLVKRAQNLPLTHSSSFEMVALDLIKAEEGRVSRGELSARMVTDLTYLLNKDILPHFRTISIKEVNYNSIQSYIAKINERKIGSNTLKLHLFHLRKILKHAWKMDLIDKIPVFPTISTVDNPREWFIDEEYNHLIKVIKAEIRKEVVVRYVPLTNELLYLVEFLVNSFLRPPDIIHMRNRQIVQATRGEHTYLRIRPTAKVAEAPVITLEAAVGFYEALTKLNETKGFGKPDDYVFFPGFENRTYAKETMRRQFSHCLVQAKLKTGVRGQARTLYSLRHTCVMNRLLKADNIDLVTLARNCRTSVEMIQRFYASHLNPEMNVDKLISFKMDKVKTKKKKAVKPAEEKPSSLEDFFELDEESSLQKLLGE
jgi:hypothetical protein